MPFILKTDPVDRWGYPETCSQDTPYCSTAALGRRPGVLTCKQAADSAENNASYIEILYFMHPGQAIDLPYCANCVFSLRDLVEERMSGFHVFIPLSRF